MFDLNVATADELDSIDPFRGHGLKSFAIEKNAADSLRLSSITSTSADGASALTPARPWAGSRISAQTKASR